VAHHAPPLYGPPCKELGRTRPILLPIWNLMGKSSPPPIRTSLIRDFGGSNSLGPVPCKGGKCPPPIVGGGEWYTIILLIIGPWAPGVKGKIVSKFSKDVFKEEKPD